MPADTAVIKMKTKAGRMQYKTQILAALAVSLGPFASGLGKGYSSPAIASLQDNSTGDNRTLDAFTITDQQASWVASLSLLGALFGGMLGGIFLRMGRKRILLALSIPYSLAWLATMFANSVKMLYATSFVAGFFCSIISMITQVYVSEIAIPEIRGCLSALLKIFGQVGVLISFSVGAYLNWHQLALVVAIAPIILFCTLFYIPETPSYLLFKGQDEDALKSLQWLRGSNSDIIQELTTIRTNILASKQFNNNNKYSWRIFSYSKLTRPVLITCGVMLFQRFSGAHVFSFYAVPMFRKTFTGMNPHAAAIATCVVQILASCLSGLLIDTVGRLPLLVTSGVLMSMALAGFGSYVYYEQVYRHYSGLTFMTEAGVHDWIPLVCVLIFTIAFSLGISPISWLLLAELFPLEYRGIGNSLSTTFSYLCAFVSVKTYVDFEQLLGLYGTFWLYAGISVCGLCFVILCVPETKGREMDEMDPKYVESLCINR